MASSIPSIKIGVSPHPSHRLPLRSSTIIRSSKAEGPLRRPASPPHTRLFPSPPLPPSPPAPAQSPPRPVEAPATKEGMVTLEYHRRVAKELQDHFKQKKLEEADQGPFFGFLGKNEMSNGREGIFKMELEAFECCSTILDLVSVTQECDVCQMGDIRICSRNADRVCNRCELRSTAKDPALQFWNH